MTTRDFVPLGVAAVAFGGAAVCWLLGCETGSTIGIAVAGAIHVGAWLFLRLVSNPRPGSRRDNPGYRSTIDWYRTRLAWLAAATLAMAIALATYDWVMS